MGIEIGGTKLQAVVGDRNAKVHAVRRGRVEPDHGAQGILAWLEREVAALLDECGADTRRRITALGIGFGGPVDSATGQVLVSHQVAGWDGVALKSWAEDRFSLPTVVANDANAAGWAEYRAGAGAGTRHFFYMNIGSGIGGALVLDGTLHDGQGRGAGEIGHTYVPDWTAELPGATDKLEHICSGWSIERRIRGWALAGPDTPLARLCGGDPHMLTCPMLAEAARAGDAQAQAEIERVANSIGIALANVLSLGHPERVALGGGVALMGETLLVPVRRAVAEYVFGPFGGRYEIVPCQLGEQVVPTGAILLALDP
mgnify:FL=1